MGEDRGKQFSEQTEQPKKPFFQLADDELLITHGTEQRIHRVVFKSKSGESEIPIVSSFFYKIKTQMEKWGDDLPLNYWKNNSYTLGLNRNGKMIIHVKSDLSVFAKEFLRSLRQDFLLTEFEIQALIIRLDFVELEISHKINDPNASLKNAKIEYDLKPFVDKLIAFTDESNGSLELEIKGDPATSSNLEYLLRDKLHAILFFAELTKVVKKLTDIQVQLFDSIQFISNALKFIIDDLLEKRFKKTEQTEQKTEQKEVS